MKITKVVYTRKYNLGNYETEDITLEAAVNDEDSPQTVLSALADQALNWHLANQRQRAAPQPVTVAPPVVKVEPPQTQSPFKHVEPKQPVKTPAQLANENTERERQAKANPETCPSCGGKKKPDYAVCYVCHMKEKEGDQ